MDQVVFPPGSSLGVHLEVKPGVPWSLISTWLQNLNCLQHLLPLVIYSGFLESFKSTFSGKR